jgi:hypothetical protein
MARDTTAARPQRDEQFRRECDATSWEVCEVLGTVENGCARCPAWEAFKARAAPAAPAKETHDG